MDDKLKQRALAMFRALEVPKTNRVKMLRKTYGTRITKAVSAEVEQIEEEIEALNQTIALIEAHA